MSNEQSSTIEEQIQNALTELQNTISSHYPEATFEVAQGDDPEGTYLRATVDVEDIDEVFDLVLDPLYRYQVEQELPVYVLTLRPVERELEAMEAAQATVPARRKAG